MNGLLAALLSVEGVAALLALAYLWLALRESLWCWLCALLSSVLYCGIFWEARRALGQSDVPCRRSRSAFCS